MAMCAGICQVASYAWCIRSLGESALGRRTVVQQPSDVHFATVSLSTDVTLHYAERGDRKGEAILFLHAYTDSGFANNFVEQRGRHGGRGADACAGRSHLGRVRQGVPYEHDLPPGS